MATDSRVSEPARRLNGRCERLLEVPAVCDAGQRVFE